MQRRRMNLKSLMTIQIKKRHYSCKNSKVKQEYGMNMTSGKTRVSYTVIRVMTIYEKIKI